MHDDSLAAWPNAIVVPTRRVATPSIPRAMNPFLKSASRKKKRYPPFTT
jgi:hypothetical protein